MVEIPEGYTELELVGFTDKGSYADGTSYVKNDLVHYGGAIYKCIVDDTVDVLPSNTSCWEVFILNHSNLDSIIAVDTEGKLGAKGEEVSAQQLVDKISKGTNQMVGATEESDGIGGIIPPPRAGDEDKALLGNGTWGKVDSIYKYKTEEEYNQAVANNEIPDGATVIKEWDEELSVIPVDSELSEESLNPLQNKVITQKIAELNQSIEELNGLLGGKLDVSKIANNLVTTEEGYALDARMGKALKDQIDTVICKKFISGSDGQHYNITVMKNGKIVSISGYAHCTGNANECEFIIPNEFRPATDTGYLPCVYQYNKSVGMVIIRTSGYIESIKAPNELAEDDMYFTATYSTL